MPPPLFDRTGNPIVQGRTLGQGGEGTVFEIGSGERADHVGKVYRHAITREKQDKIRGMASIGDSYLKEIAAWPLETLHAARGGEVIGFIMSKVSHHEPIHHLYGPTHRKQLFPKSDFSFLVHVSRNMAAAFDAIHHHGHVIGDVNHGNLVVGPDARVKLIDCDSFQIKEGGATHLCEVGVAIFTPPELQSAKSFRGIIRTPNHDNFGLALLVFHLLQMGRHPFSGVYNMGKGDMPLERAIAEFRFAYGASRRAKQMDMPPSALPLNFLPEMVSTLFERAFGESGATGNRPTASEWVAGLDSLRKSLRACAAEPIHKYASHLNSCPWCNMERTTGTQFFLPFLLSSTGTVIPPSNWAELWSQIQSLAPPPVLMEYHPPTQSVEGEPPPSDRLRARNLYVIFVPMVLLALIGGLFALPNLMLIWVGLGAFFTIKFKHPYTKQRRERKALRDSLRSELDSKLNQYKELASIKPFKDLQSELGRVRTEFDRLEPAYQAERQKLRENLQSQQLKKYMEGFFLSQAKIPGIGSTRMAVLESFGVETAADIDEWKILKVPGFGRKLTDELLRWRRKIQTGFKFNPQQGVDPREEQQLLTRFNQKRVQLHETLQEGFSKLQRLKLDMTSRRSALKASLDQSAQAVQRAEANVLAVSKW